MYEMTKMPGKRLGKLAPKQLKHMPMLCNFLEYAQLPVAPPKVDWTKKVVNWPMMKNDVIGDCTIAAAGHMVQCWSVDSSGMNVTISDPDIIKAYSDVSGYNPVTGANDNGAVETDVLSYWRHNGIGGHKIAAYASLEVDNLDEIKSAVNLFGGVYIGVALPLSAQDQIGKVWSIPHGGARGYGAPGSWGGHAVPVLAYDQWGLTCVTWGALQRMSWNFWKAYCDESYAVIGPEWINSKGKAPNGFDLSSLQNYLDSIAA